MKFSKQPSAKSKLRLLSNSPSPTLQKGTIHVKICASSSSLVTSKSRHQSRLCCFGFGQRSRRCKRIVVDFLAVIAPLSVPSSPLDLPRHVLASAPFLVAQASLSHRHPCPLQLRPTPSLISLSVSSLASLSVSPRVVCRPLPITSFPLVSPSLCRATVIVLHLHHRSPSCRRSM